MTAIVILEFIKAEDKKYTDGNLFVIRLSNKLIIVI